ncbi:uncharacterized protein LOC110022594 isoform X2 [Phalaenopsis equestris]|nr:uncharacterized protein LOC110022594 isoform X2 [Phalaenopsis equestris]
MNIMKQDNDASLREFMKMSLEGISWAENICQRVEDICTENNMVQNPEKYVNAVGEHFKKVIHTVVDNLCDHADDVIELFSELTSGHASLVKKSGKMGEAGDFLNEKPFAYICEKEAAFMETSSLEHDSVPKVVGNLGPGSKKSISDGSVFTSGKLDKDFSSTVDSLLEHGDGTVIHETSRIEIDESDSLETCAAVGFEQEATSVEDLSQVKLPSEPQFLNKKEDSDVMLSETDIFAAEGLNCSTGNFCNLIPCDVNLTSSPSLTEANSSISCKINATSEPSPSYSLCSLDLEPQEASCLSECNGSKLTSGNGHRGREISSTHENLNICSREEFCNSSIFSLKDEDLNEFEDVKLEDDFEAVKAENDWDDMLKAEIALISSLAAKKESSKKKLKKMLTSRWRPSRGSKLVTFQTDLHSKTSLDSDWELL